MIPTAIKVSERSSVTYLEWISSKYELCVSWCGYKHNHQNDTCLKEIGQCAENFHFILNNQHSGSRKK